MLSQKLLQRMSSINVSAVSRMYSRQRKRNSRTELLLIITKLSQRDERDTIRHGILSFFPNVVAIIEIDVVYILSINKFDFSNSNIHFYKVCFFNSLNRNNP